MALAQKGAVALAILSIGGVPATIGVQKGYEFVMELMHGAQGVAGEVGDTPAGDTTATTIPK